MKKALKELLESQSNSDLRQIEKTIEVIRLMRRQKLYMPDKTGVAPANSPLRVLKNNVKPKKQATV